MPSPCKYFAVQFYSQYGEVALIVCCPLDKEELRQFIEHRVSGDYFFQIVSEGDREKVTRSVIKRKLHCVAEAEVSNCTYLANTIICLNNLWREKEIWWRIETENDMVLEISDAEYKSRSLADIISGELVTTVKVSRIYK